KHLHRCLFHRRLYRVCDDDVPLHGVSCNHRTHPFHRHILLSYGQTCICRRRRIRLFRHRNRHILLFRRHTFLFHHHGRPYHCHTLLSRHRIDHYHDCGHCRSYLCRPTQNEVNIRPETSLTPP